MKIKNALYGIISVLMILGLLVGFSLSVNGRSDMDERVKQEHLKVLTEEFKTSVREYLNEEDFVNCGIMITYVTDHKSGEMTYYIRLHHKRFEKLTEDERNRLSGDITDLVFCAENCLFEVVFE